MATRTIEFRRYRRFHRFPEGTSSDGSKVLQFHSSLLQPAIDAPAPITPVHISGTAEDGHAAAEVCYWGEMMFVPHLWRMLGTKRIKAVVHVGEPRLFSERKTAAQESRREIVALAGNEVIADFDNRHALPNVQCAPA